MSPPDTNVTFSSPHVDVTMSSPHVDVKTTLTSPRSGEDIDSSVASIKTSTTSKKQVFSLLKANDVVSFYVER